MTTENEDKDSYKPFNVNIMEISDIESSEDEDPEERNRRIEQLAATMNVMNEENKFKRGELNMDIDTLSERSEDESDREQRQPKQRSRRPSGRKRSMSRERNVAKIRYYVILVLITKIASTEVHVPKIVASLKHELIIYIEGIVGDVIMQVMKTGSAEKMFSREDGVQDAWRQVTGRTRAGSPQLQSHVLSAIFLVICLAFTKLQTSDRGNLSLIHLDGCPSKIGFR